MSAHVTKPVTKKGEKYDTVTHKVVCRGAAKKLKKNRSSESGSELAGYCKYRRNDMRKLGMGKPKKK